MAGGQSGCSTRCKSDQRNDVTMVASTHLIDQPAETRGYPESSPKGADNRSLVMYGARK